MESFHSDDSVASGERIHYPHDPQALQLVTVRSIQAAQSGTVVPDTPPRPLSQDEVFRKSWSMEAVSVLAGMRAGAQIKFGDRLHKHTFDRIVANRSLNEMRPSLTPTHTSVSLDSTVATLQAEPHQRD